MPFFSVVIPLYNKENHIEKTIQSVLDQAFADFEIIIINDGSTDNGEQKVFNFKDNRIRYYLKKNEGVSIARNLGIEKSTSNYVCFLDADDYWYPDFLQEFHKIIQLHPEQKAFSCAIEVETCNSLFPSEYSIAKQNDFEIVNFFKASSKECILWTSSTVLHQDVFKKAGNFDPAITVAEDTDLWIRVGINYPIVFIWKILARYVYDRNSVSRNFHYIFENSSFLKYTEYEKQNIDLKKYMDLNRFSAAIKSKLIDDIPNFKKIYGDINLNNLSLRKRILLRLPAFILKKLIFLKLKLAYLGLGRSIFK